MKTKTEPATIGQRIRAARLAAGMTQLDVARKTGIRANNISSIECGKHPTPTVTTLKRLAAALGCEVGELMG